MERKGGKKAPAVSKQKFKLEPSLTSTFSTILEILFSSGVMKEFNDDSIKALRLTSKEVEKVVDVHLKSFLYQGPYDGDLGVDQMHSIRSLSRWPWPNITNFQTRMVNFNLDPDRLQRDFEHITSLPLLGLKSVRLRCCDVTPLLEVNWPLLTDLWLDIDKGSESVEYLESLTFPRWSLKNLELDSLEVINSNFIGPLLRGCGQKLTSLTLQLNGDLTKELATSIVESTPLLQLEELVILAGVYQGFYPKLFELNFPALKDLSLSSTDGIYSSIFAKHELVTRLESLSLYSGRRLSATELRGVLKALEKGAIKSLYFASLDISAIFEGFKGIKIGTLDTLHIGFCGARILGQDADISDVMNAFFESGPFPQLEQIEIETDGYALYADEESEFDDYEKIRPKWCRPPSISGQLCAESFANLKSIELSAMSISSTVAKYLGIIRRKTDCELDVSRCYTEQTPLSEDRLQFLKKLDISLADWANFCRRFHHDDFVEDLMYWNIMSDDRFKLIALATSLEAAKGKEIFSVDEILAPLSNSE